MTSFDKSEHMLTVSASDALLAPVVLLLDRGLDRPSVVELLGPAATGGLGRTGVALLVVTTGGLAALGVAVVKLPEPVERCF